MTGRRCAAALGAAVLAAGCGGGGESTGGGETGVPAVQQCLEDSERFDEVTEIDADELDTQALSEQEHSTIERATEPATGGLVATAGGPTERDGVISEAPFSKTRIYFFATAPEAERAAAEIEPVVGTPDDAVLNGVRAIGKATVVHYSIEIGDDPGGVALPAEPVERCLTEGGFSSG